MKKNAQIPQSIKEFREAHYPSQKAFADALGVGQTVVSAWERGDNLPSSEAWVKLGNLAPYPDCMWFWEQAGISEQALLSATEKLSKERGIVRPATEIVRVPIVRKMPEGNEETGRLLPVSAEEVPNPLSTVCLIASENEASPLVSSGELIILDISQKGAADLRPFLNQTVLADARGSMNLTGWRRGLLIGRLLLKRFGGSASRERPWHSFVVTIGPFGDSQTVWEPRYVEAVRLGEWTRPIKIELLHPIRHGGMDYSRGVHDLPADLATLFLSFRGGEEHVHLARLFEPGGEAPEESEVAGEIRLYPGCQILGIVRALFPASSGVHG